MVFGGHSDWIPVESGIPQGSDLDYCSPVWNPFLIKNIATVEQIQRTATRMTLKQRRQDEPYESRLARLNLSPISN